MFCLFNLYVPVNLQEKRECWNSLAAFLNANSFSNLIIAGDLNLILNAKEKVGGVYGRDPMLNWVDNFILKWEMIDFKPKKGKFTWSNNRLGSTNISARLDHFLVQSSLLADKTVISSSNLPKITSDHKPILLQIENEEDLGPIPFRFSPLWKDRDGFMRTVILAWEIPVAGSPNYVWERKLINTKAALKNWVKLTQKKPTSERKEALQNLEKIQLEMEETEITLALLAKEQNAQSISFQAFRREEEYWRLKSRSTLLKVGDRNTSFFHKQCRVRISQNHSSEIYSQSGEVVKGNSQIKLLAETHFSEPLQGRWTL